MDELAIHLTKYWGKKSGEFNKVRFLLNEEPSLNDFKKSGELAGKRGEVIKEKRLDYFNFF